jgi:hypothetical protein
MAPVTTTSNYVVFSDACIGKPTKLEYVTMLNVEKNAGTMSSLLMCDMVNPLVHLNLIAECF